MDVMEDGKVDANHLIGFVGKQYQDQFLQHDANGDGKLTVVEYVYGDASELKRPVIHPDDKEVFDAHDRDGDGMVTVDEMIHTNMAGPYKVLTELFKTADLDEDAFLSEEEWVTLLSPADGGRRPMALALFAEALDPPPAPESGHDEL